MTLARLLNDFEMKEYKYKARNHPDNGAGGVAHLNATPQTVQFLDRPTAMNKNHPFGLGKASPFNMPQNWRNHLRAINTEAAYRYICVPKAGWFNTGEFKPEALGFGDNLVNVLETRSGFARIQTININDPIPVKFDYESHPYLFHQFTVITRNGRIDKAGAGNDATEGQIVYTFLLSKAQFWVALKRLDFNHLEPLRTWAGEITIPEPDVPDVPPPVLSGNRIVVTKRPFAIVRQRPDEKSPQNLKALYGTRLEIASWKGDWGLVAPMRGWILKSEVKIVS